MKTKKSMLGPDHVVELKESNRPGNNKFSNKTIKLLQWNIIIIRHQTDQWHEQVKKLSQ